MYILFESRRSLAAEDINKLFSLGTYFLSLSDLLRRRNVIIVCLHGESRYYDEQEEGSISLGVARAITLKVFLAVAQGGDAIYGFVRQCNNLSKPSPGRPNPELRGPGNDLVNRTVIMIS